jgi:hypothetical protein
MIYNYTYKLSIDNKQIEKGEERLDKYHKKILEYVKNNSEQTENQIVNAMHKKKICSKVTTLKKIDELIVKNEIKDLLKQGESGFHKYIINNENEFNLINDKLLQIENFMSEVYEKFLNQFKQNFTPRPAGTVLAVEEVSKFNSLIEYCFHGIVLFLLQDIFSKVESEKDKQILYDRVIRLMLKLSHLRQKGRVEFFSKQIMHLETFIQSHDFELIFYHYDISNREVKKLVSIMENLK